jgi:hypothetical protein
VRKTPSPANCNIPENGNENNRRQSPQKGVLKIKVTNATPAINMKKFKIPAVRNKPLTRRPKIAAIRT